MFYVVDGNNVLGAMGIDGDSEGREKLSALLTSYVGIRDVEIVLVFDTRSDGWPVSVFEDLGSIQLYGVDPKYQSNADDTIVDYFKDHPTHKKIATVVTADSGLRKRLREIEVTQFMDPVRLMEIVGDPQKYEPKTDQPPVLDDEKENLLSPAQRAAINQELSQKFGQTEH